MDDQFDLEELSLADGEELEEIRKMMSGSRYNYPCVAVMQETMYFNTAAKAMLPDCIKWFTTSELIILMPAEKGEKNAFAVNKSKHGDTGAVSRYPVSLQHKKVGRGTYKLYKFKDGLAFKRYEPLVSRG